MLIKESFYAIISSSRFIVTSFSSIRRLVLFVVRLINYFETSSFIYLSHMNWSKKSTNDYTTLFIHLSFGWHWPRVTESAEKKILSYKKFLSFFYLKLRKKIIGHNYGIKRFMVKWRKLAVDGKIVYIVATLNSILDKFRFNIHLDRHECCWIKMYELVKKGSPFVEKMLCLISSLSRAKEEWN